MEAAAAPQDEVEIEHARSPAPSAATPECALDRLEAGQHLGRFRLAFDQRHGIGEIATGPAMRGVEYDRRSVEQAEILIEARDRGLDHASRAAEAPVRPVGAECDGVEVGHAVGVTQSVTPAKAGVPLFCDRDRKAGFPLARE